MHSDSALIRSFRLLPLLLGAVLVAETAHADPSSTSVEQGYDLGEVYTPRSVGMGGAQTALGTSTNAIFLNPANLALAKVYHFEGLAAVSPDARRQSYGGAVADSVTSKLAGGFGGTFNELDPDGIHRQWTDLRLALAYPLADKLSVGMTGRYLRVSQNTAAGPFGSSLPSDGNPSGPILNNFTFDMGITAIPTTGLNISLVGHNLTNPGNGLAPTTLVGGIGYATGIVAVEADALADFSTWKGTRGRAMLGAEVFVADHFPIRIGYRYDDGQRAHSLSVGTGYVDKKWSFELSARRDIVADHPMTLFVAGLRYFYDTGASTNTPESGTDSF